MIRLFKKSKSYVNPTPNQDEFELAKAASLKLTPAQFYALVKTCRSDVYWPGLKFYFDYNVNAKV